MKLTAPEWLALRGGDLKLGSDKSTWYVYFGADPEYAVNARPLGDRFGFIIRQTINGKILESDLKFASAEEAIQAGLEELRKELGWG